MGSIKDINSMDLIESEGIKKRWQDYIEELYKKCKMAVWGGLTNSCEKKRSKRQSRK